MNIAVAMVQAAVVVRAQRRARQAIGRVSRRELTLSGVSSTQRKESGAETRKRPNMMWEMVRTRPRIIAMLEGRATESS